jgi:hypothetical protein
MTCEEQRLELVFRLNLRNEKASSFSLAVVLRLRSALIRASRALPRFPCPAVNALPHSLVYHVCPNEEDRDGRPTCSRQEGSENKKAESSR